LGLGLPCLVSDVILLLAGGPAGAVFTSFLLGCAVPVGVSILRARGVIAQRHSLEAQVAEYASHPRLADAGALFQRGRFTEAIPLFRQITCERPNIHRAWIDLARCEVRCDQSDAAVDTLTRAARIYPDDALILYNRACYLVKSGDVQRFVDDLARAIAIESRYREMAWKDPDFEIVRGTDAFQAAVAEAL
jgi:tetratricopeptide (TPR) repeat protein